MKEKAMKNEGCLLSENIEANKIYYWGEPYKIVYDETDVFNEAGEPDFSLFERELDKKEKELDEKAKASLNEIIGRGTNIASISGLNKIAKDWQRRDGNRGGESKL